MAAIKIACDEFRINDDTLVIGGDTLFLDDFDLAKTIDCFIQEYRNGAAAPYATMLLAYNTNDKGASKSGILEVDSSNQVVWRWSEKIS